MSKKYSYNFIKNEFEKYNYKLLSDEYINAHHKLKYQCDKGHNHFITWNHWRDGHRCPFCDGQAKLPIEKVKYLFEENGYVLLSNDYKNSHTKLYYICPKGHKGSVTLTNWLKGTRCSKCAIEHRAKLQRLSKEYIIDSFKNEGYKILIDVYENVGQKLKCFCPNGHVWKVNWHDWNSGVRCPKCFDGASVWEKVIRQIIEELRINYIANDRSILKNPYTNTPLELDIWIPDLNKAIECNGDYWHSFEDRIEIDSIKQSICRELGIELLVVMYSEWYKNKLSCKDNIIKFLHKRGRNGIDVANGDGNAMRRVATAKNANKM